MFHFTKSIIIIFIIAKQKTICKFFGSKDLLNSECDAQITGPGLCSIIAEISNQKTAKRKHLASRFYFVVILVNSPEIWKYFLNMKHFSSKSTI